MTSEKITETLPLPSPPADSPAAEAMPIDAAVAEDSPLSWDRTVRPALLAIRKLWLPFVLLQSCGLGLVLAYYYWPAVRAGCDALAVWKVRGGYAFSATLMAFSSGLVPEVFKFITGVDRQTDRRRANDLLFVMAIYAVSGMLTDGFYRLLPLIYGSGVGLRTIVAKVLTDQFVYTPVLGVGLIAIPFAWRRLNYDTPRLLRQMGPRWYAQTYVPMLLPCWAYWIPMTSLMYALPPSLTLCFGATASGAISLVYTTIAAMHDEEHRRQ